MTKRYTPPPIPEEAAAPGPAQSGMFERPPGPVHARSDPARTMPKWLVFGAIAGKGRPTEAELSVLERYLNFRASFFEDRLILFGLVTLFGRVSRPPGETGPGESR